LDLINFSEYELIAHTEAAKFIEESPPQHELTATRLGRYRVEIEKHLHREIEKMDKLVKMLIK